MDEVLARNTVTFPCIVYSADQYVEKNLQTQEGRSSLQPTEIMGSVLQEEIPIYLGGVSSNGDNILWDGRTPSRVPREVRVLILPRVASYD